MNFGVLLVLLLCINSIFGVYVTDKNKLLKSGGIIETFKENGLVAICTNGGSVCVNRNGDVTHNIEYVWKIEQNIGHKQLFWLNSEGKNNYLTYNLLPPYNVILNSRLEAQINWSFDDNGNGQYYLTPYHVIHGKFGVGYAYLTYFNNDFVFGAGKHTLFSIYPSRAIYTILTDDSIYGKATLASSYIDKTWNDEQYIFIKVSNNDYKICNSVNPIYCVTVNPANNVIMYHKDPKIWTIKHYNNGYSISTKVNGQIKYGYANPLFEYTKLSDTPQKFNIVSV